MTEQLLARGDRVAGTVRKLDAIKDLNTKCGGRLWPTKRDNMLRLDLNYLAK